MSYSPDDIYNEFRPPDKWERIEAKIKKLERKLAECKPHELDSIDELKAEIARLEAL